MCVLSCHALSHPTLGSLRGSCAKRDKMRLFSSLTLSSSAHREKSTSVRSNCPYLCLQVLRTYLAQYFYYKYILFIYVLLNSNTCSHYLQKASKTWSKYLYMPRSATSAPDPSPRPSTKRLPRALSRVRHGQQRSKKILNMIGHAAAVLATHGARVHGVRAPGCAASHCLEILAAHAVVLRAARSAAGRGGALWESLL